MLILDRYQIKLYKAGKSLLATPVVLSLDRHEEIFANGNYFKKTPADKGWFVMDVLFTNLIVRHLVVFSWWSLWELENQFLQVLDIRNGHKLMINNVYF